MLKITNFIFILFVFTTPVVAAMDCPSIPAIPVPDNDDLTFQENWNGPAEPYSARHATNYKQEPDFGIGYLKITNPNNYYYDWTSHIILPLWQIMNEESFYGWLHGGRVYLDQDDSFFILTGAGFVETEYELSNFIIYKTNDDGWLQIRLKPGDTGLVWIHQCHLEIGDAKLKYKNWESYITEHRNWLHFRSQVPHSLREQPDIKSPRIILIGLNHKLIMREIQGDWMRVTVEQPDWTCSGPDQEQIKTVHEGWVKWRDENIGPWTWVYTRGC